MRQTRRLGIARTIVLGLPATGLMLLVLPAGAEAQNGIIADRTNNAIVNVDKIAGRYREEIRAEIQRLAIRSRPLPPQSAAEAAAMRQPGAWWQSGVGQSIGGGGKTPPMRFSLAYAYDSAMLNSAQMRAFGDLPAIRETQEAEIRGRYALRAYGEGRYEDVNDPTRSVANTRGSDRLRSHERSAEFGLRQRLLTGADMTIGQRFLNYKTNSLDYIPDRQSTTRTFITIVQPLLRESGIAYSRSLHEVARLDAKVGLSEFRRQAESHLLEVARAYWSLHLARATYLQRQRLAQAAGGLVDQLSGREGLDADILLTSRARSAQALREADLLRARAAVASAEARLRGLVNDPRFLAQDSELVPVDMPLGKYEPLTLQTVVERAVAFRPEVEQAFLQHRAAVLRQGQAQIEALPRVDLIVGGNLGGRGLGSGTFGNAFDDERRNASKPGLLFGLRIEVPLQADDAKARLDRRRLETRLAENQGRALLMTIIAEAEVTMNEYEVAWRELGARALALRAARTELGIESERWLEGVAGTKGEGAANGLERLLTAQERLADAEERLALAQATFTVAFLALQRVQGTFTAAQNVDIQRIEDAARGPAYNLRRVEAPAPAPEWAPKVRQK